jgi:pantoate--beta-alanine ligase
MKIVQTEAQLKDALAAFRVASKRLAFVPTMGNLHAGHLALMREAQKHADVVVASIYVNPLQFGQNEDLAAYPRTPNEDVAALQSVNVDVLFMPDTNVMYPRGLAAQTTVEVPGLGDILCGPFRPGHFRGVATVVNRLFNLVGPHVALFGKKDFQQLMVIRQMVADLGMPVRVVGVDTVREADGLAMSSRNGYLTQSERAVAPKLYETLCRARDQSVRCEPLQTVQTQARQALTALGFRPDYVAIRRQADLGEPAGDNMLVILAAAWLGRTRLIDNLEFSV